MAERNVRIRLVILKKHVTAFVFTSQPGDRVVSMRPVRVAQLPLPADTSPPALLRALADELEDQDRRAGAPSPL